ncbi:MAG: glycine zipper family protein [Syntrophorhabdales bacterium]|jgi:outer membrane lipoprotein SlyB
MNLTRGVLIFLALALLGGCATMPTGPMVTVYPAPGKPFEVFQADDYACRQWAQAQIGGASPSQTANQNLASGAVVGTLVGAGLGAAIGAATGNIGAGAAIGAGAGLLTGTATAGGPAASSGYQLQRRYDMAYQQCMYAKGNQIPGVRPVRAYGPPPGYGPPPPPRAYGPPPPPQQ